MGIICTIPEPHYEDGEVNVEGENVDGDLVPEVVEGGVKDSEGVETNTKSLVYPYNYLNRYPYSSYYGY